MMLALTSYATSTSTSGQEELQVMLMALLWGSVNTLRDLGAARGLNCVWMVMGSLRGPMPRGPTTPTWKVWASQADSPCTVVVKLLVNILGPATYNLLIVSVMITIVHKNIKFDNNIIDIYNECKLIQVTTKSHFKFCT